MYCFVWLITYIVLNLGNLFCPHLYLWSCVYLCAYEKPQDPWVGSWCPFFIFNGNVERYLCALKVWLIELNYLVKIIQKLYLLAVFVSFSCIMFLLHFLSSFFSFSETFMGEGRQNNKRKVLHSESYTVFFQILWFFKWYCNIFYFATQCPEFEVHNSSLSLSPLSFASMFNRYDPEIDGRILLAKVDCTEEGDLCKRYILDWLFLLSTWFSNFYGFAIDFILYTANICTFSSY